MLYDTHHEHDPRRLKHKASKSCRQRHAPSSRPSSCSNSHVGAHLSDVGHPRSRRIERTMPSGQPTARTQKTPSKNRHELGPFWLWYRDDRDDWAICWYENGAGGNGRRTRRKSLGIGGGDADKPPKAAQDALAEHYLASQRPVQAPIADVYVEKLMADWLLQHAQVHLRSHTHKGDSQIG